MPASGIQPAMPPRNMRWFRSAKQIGDQQGDGQQDRQDDRQRAHALQLAAQDLAPQRIGIERSGIDIGHRPAHASQPARAPQRRAGMLGTGPCR